MPAPSQTLSTTDSTWVSPSHPNGLFPIPNPTEWMMEEAASEPVLLSRMGILERQNHHQVQLEGVKNRSRAKATADPAGISHNHDHSQTSSAGCAHSLPPVKGIRRKRRPWSGVQCYVPLLIEIRSLLQSIQARDF